MWNDTKKFIEKLQASPEPVRRRWLIGLSSVSAVLVIMLWTGYINLIAKPTHEEAQVASEEGFTANFGRGFKIVFGEAREHSGRLTGSVRELLRSENEISFERKPEDFIVDNLPPVPRTPIP